MDALKSNTVESLKLAGKASARLNVSNGSPTDAFQQQQQQQQEENEQRQYQQQDSVSNEVCRGRPAPSRMSDSASNGRINSQNPALAHPTQVHQTCQCLPVV
jgi:hypothetical protein